MTAPRSSPGPTSCWTRAPEAVVDPSGIWPARRAGQSGLFVWLERLARVSAAIGGAAIFAVALTVTLSVIMRNIGLRGIRGDFELVELSCVFAAGFFLPLCQLSRNHVMVDLFTNWLPDRIRGGLDRLWLVIFALGWGALCWFTWHGLLDIRGYGDRTMLLRLPLWWAYVPSALGTAASALIAVAQILFPGGELPQTSEA